jgi:predicted aspartyl protease
MGFVVFFGFHSITPELFYYHSSLGRTHLPLVTVEHNGEKYLFLVDTGSTISIVSPRLLANLEVDLLDEIFVEQTQSLWSYYEITERITIAGMNERGIIVFSDQVKILDSINSSVSLTIDGILGMNYLRFFNLKSQMGEGILNFKQTLLMRIAQKLTESVSSPTPKIKLEISGVESQAILDTGYTGFLQIPETQHLTVMGGDSIASTRSSITVDNVGGENNQLIIIPEITFSNSRIVEDIPTDVSKDTKILVGNLLLARISVSRRWYQNMAVVR